MPDIISNYYEGLDIKGTPNLENQMVNSDFDITHFQIIALDSKKPKTLAYIVKNGIKTKKRSFEKANLRSVARYISKKNKAQFIFELNKGDRNFVTLARSYKVDQREDRIFVVLGLRKKLLGSLVKRSKDTRSFIFTENLVTLDSGSKAKPNALKKRGVRNLILSDVGSGFAGQTRGRNGTSCIQLIITLIFMASSSSLSKRRAFSVTSF